MYAVYVNNKRISKYYKHREQAVVHAYEHGLVASGRGEKWLLCDIMSIKEKTNEDFNTTVNSFFIDMASKQTRLPKDVEECIYDNLHKCYI